MAASFRPISSPTAGQITQNNRDRDHTGNFFRARPTLDKFIHIVHIAYEDFDGCGEMQSSVATESSAVITERASRRILTASIRGGGVSRLLFRQIISKFQSDNLTGELERAYRASAFSHRDRFVAVNYCLQRLCNKSGLFFIQGTQSMYSFS